MSNPLFSQETGHKYTFQLQLKKLFISPSLPFEVKIIWARGQNKIESQNPIKLQPPQNEITLQQCFCNKSTVLFNPKKFQFRKKQSRIQIILYANGSPKQGGEFVLNLCEILDPYNIKKQQQKIYRVVTRQQKPRCEIQFKLTAQYCQQMIRDEQRSIGSGVGSISSKNTTSMGYGGTNNFDTKQYIEKKNLFLYEAPSKDNQSVISYNSYSTNMMRYQSGNKKQRQDSLHKQEYGLATTTRMGSNTGDMFNKTTSVNMKSVSGEYDNKSRGGYNRVTQQLQLNTNSNNFDNRTENFDNGSNKLLQQEQAKRSKLQAQVSKLNIYMKQQSNKITEYIQQNTRLKQQLNRMSSQQQTNKTTMQKQKQTLLIRQQFQQQLQLLKRQNQDLHKRQFQVNNENRQLKIRLQLTIKEKQQLQQQAKIYKNQKQRAESKYDALNRNMQTIILSNQQSSKEINNLKDELEHIKSLNSNLRDSLEKERRKIEELQSNTNYQRSSIQDTLKKKQTKIYQLEKQVSTLMTQIRDRETEIETKKELLYRLEKTANQYKDKILISDSQKSKLLLENASLKNENEKLRYEISNSTGFSQTMRQELQDKKNEIYRLQNNMKALKQIQNKFYFLEKTQNEKQILINTLKQQNSKLHLRTNEIQNISRTLMSENQQLKKKALNVPDVDVNEILRQSVQMQVELKFKNDELIRLKNIEQKFNDLLYRFQNEQKSRKQLEQEMQKLQKQVKDKNKLYLIEVQKGKLFIKENQQKEKQFEQCKIQLKRCQEIIFNGDRQVKEMENHIIFLQNQNNQLTKRNKQAQNELSLVLNKLNESSKLEQKIKELSQEAQSASQKLIKMQDSHSSVASDLQRVLTDKKSLELKCETIMAELHSLKKQYEEEKVRSTSVVSIRSNQDQVKIRQLQHDIQKKDKMISKLTKQKLQIEEENINLHVQVMKKLSEMERNKDSLAQSTSADMTPK